MAPIDPAAAARAERAIVANPRNAAAIINQLDSDPNNRIIPPGYVPPPTLLGPGYSLPVHLEPTHAPMGPLTPAQVQGMQAFVSWVQSQRNNPLSPMGMAIQLGKLENNPAHRQAAANMEFMGNAQQMAAQRDIQLGLELEQIRQANLTLQQQVAMDVQFIEWTNQNFRQTGACVLPVLNAITGVDLDDEPEKWRSSWMDQLDLSQGVSRPGRKPTYQDRVVDATDSLSARVSPAPERAPTYTEGVAAAVASAPVRACFAAGTMVHTIDGPRRIEMLQAGDRVLCQHTATGSLEFRPVLAVHRNKPALTLRIVAGGDSILATDLQRFWETGKGLTMARDLAAGDRLRTLGGVAPVASIEKVRTQPDYDVDVAEHADLFVGSARFLAHDFGFVPSVPETFDRPADLSPKAVPSRPVSPY